MLTLYGRQRRGLVGAGNQPLAIDKIELTGKKGKEHLCPRKKRGQPAGPKRKPEDISVPSKDQVTRKSKVEAGAFGENTETQEPRKTRIDKSVDTSHGS